MDTPETVIEHIAGNKTFTMYAGERFSVNMVKRFATELPDKVKIITENSDGSLVAHIDFSLFPKLHKPRQLSEEQKKLAAQRLQAFRGAGGD